MLILDPSELTYHEVNEFKVQKYIKLMVDGELFPPIEVHLLPSGKYIVCNGAHRTVACKRLGVDISAIEVSTFEDPSLNIPTRRLVHAKT
jgi:hypothetical protein